MTRFFPVVTLVGLLGYAALGSAGPGALRAHARAVQGEFEWEGHIDAGQAIEIQGINGDIRAQPTAGDEVVVTAVKREGRRGDPDDVTFDVLEHSGGVTICAVYPSKRDDRPNECRSGGRGHMNVHRNDTRVHFTVRVPAGVDFVGRNVNGDVDAEALGANVRAYTVNGSITVEAAGYAEARTVNGSIRARLGRGNWTEPLEFETVNGGITIELPDDLGADVTASTVNGSIETDFPLTVTGRFSSRRLTGTIGGGGRRIGLETVNGSIRLVKGR